jgi:hypothetical protein
MNTIKCFSLLIAGTLLSTAALAQNVTTPIAEVDAKPVVAKPIASNTPAPGTRIVPVEPVHAIKATQQPQAFKMDAAPNDLAAPKPLQTTEIMPAKVDAVALPIPDVNAMQAKMTEQQKATMAGKTVRPKTIDQTTGVTEGKLTPTTAKPIMAAEPVIAPIVEN